MFLFREPDPGQLAHFLCDVRGMPLSYPEVGATQGVLPRGYACDHNRVELGAGPDVFASASESVRRWQMFRLGWARVFPAHAPLAEGSTVAVVGHHFGFWSLNACRIVYVLDEPRCFGFAYGTLPVHAERGEERFTIEWNADDSVWYDILAFSTPNSWLARIGYPFSRALQHRFARDSKQAMLDDVRAAG